jgi:hypothetical protein
MMANTSPTGRPMVVTIVNSFMAASFRMLSEATLGTNRYRIVTAGIAGQRTGRIGRSWATCPLLRI